MLPTTFEPRRIFECLVRHGVKHVVIGGLAGIANDVFWPTYDADVVVEASDENLARLVEALSELDAEYDTPHRPPIRPDRRLVRISHGPQLFRTKFGRLDVLKEAGGETFDSLGADAVTSEQFGVVLYCASISALLRMKRAANRPKDQPAIALLENALRKTRAPTAEEPLRGNPNCLETRATMRIRVADDADPAGVTRALGLEPTRSLRRGEPREGGGAPPRASLWMLSTEGRVDSTRLEDHLAFLLDAIERVPPERLHDVLGRGEVDFFCFWVSKHGHGGPDIGPETLGRIAQLGAGLSFDVYFADDDE